MTESKRVEDVDDMEQDGGDKGVWPRIMALLTGLGAAGAYVVTNWDNVEPVLSSPVAVLFGMFAFYGLGGLSVYWLVGRPLEKRLAKAERLIRRMRDRERGLESQVGDLRVELAEMRTVLKMRGMLPIEKLGLPAEEQEG